MNVLEELRKHTDTPPRVSTSAYLTPDQRKHLEWLAKRSEQSISTTIAKLIDRAYREAHEK